MIAIIAAFYISSVYSVGISIQADFQLGGGNGDYATAVARDSLDNIFVAGYTFNSLYGTYVSMGDLWIAKYDANTYSNTWSWQNGTSQAERMYEGLCVDFNDDVVMGATIGNGQPLFGQAQGGKDIGFIKFASPGGIVWKRQIGTTSDDEVENVVCDGADGAVFVIGITDGNLYGSNQGGTDFFISKWSKNGNFLYGVQQGQLLEDFGVGGALDLSGNLIVTGDTTSSLYDTTRGNEDLFVAKFNPNLTLLTSYQNGTAMTDKAKSVDVDSGDNIVIAGATNGNFSTVGAKQNYDIFIQKLDNNLNVISLLQDGTSQVDNAYSIVIDSFDQVWVGGHTSGSFFDTIQGNDDFVSTTSFATDDGFVARYNLNNANATYGDQGGFYTNGFVEIYSIVMFSTGNIMGLYFLVFISIFPLLHINS